MVTFNDLLFIRKLAKHNHLIPFYPTKKFHKTWFLFFFVLAHVSLFGQTQVLLFTENFDSPSNLINTFFNGNIPDGPNRWIVNDNYDGLSFYPNTTQQDNTVSGTITNAPTSEYLHIHDTTMAGSNGVLNANYDNNVPSENFAIVTPNPSVCSYSLTNVTFTYFWTGEGSSTAYGELYYEKDFNGNWTKIGPTQMNGQTNWKYEEIADPAFDNARNIRFGFLWTNDNTGGIATSSFGIDDVQMVGEYNNNIDITIDNVTAQVCQDDDVSFNVNFTDTLCTGTYEIEVSDRNGNFNNGIGSYVATIGNTASSTRTVNIPSTAPAGTCYRIRVNRVSPGPVISGMASGCFEVIECPNSITTMAPLMVTADACNICVNSVISVPFASDGAFAGSNRYYAQLSDSSGSFATPRTINSVVDGTTYDGPNPGSVGGLVPEVPAGCNYMLRIVSDNPQTIGTEWGPFCIRECDIETNETNSIQLCVSQTEGDSVLMSIDMNVFEDTTTYGANNEFALELIETMFFGRVNLGGLSIVNAATDTTAWVVAPPLPDLFALGIQPGAYLGRIVPSNSSAGACNLGTLINVSIGSPREFIDIIGDSIFCPGEISTFRPTPPSLQSSYEWWMNPNPFTEPSYVRPAGSFGSFSINFANFPRETYELTVQETNFGCVGEPSAPFTLDVIGPPSTYIRGLNPVCSGTPQEYSVVFYDKTYYEWNLSGGGEVIEQGNNIATFLFDTVGTVTLDVLALNKCGSDADDKTVDVLPHPDLTAIEDQEICEGDSVVLSATYDNSLYSKWGVGASTTNIATEVNTITVTPDSTLEYFIEITDGTCPSVDSILITVFQAPHIDAGADEQICVGDVLKATSNDSDIVVSYNWTGDNTISDPTILNPEVLPSATTTYVITVMDSNNCFNSDSVIITLLYNSPANDETPLCVGTSIVLDGQYGESIEYLWSTNETTPEITVSEEGLYTVELLNPSNGCFAIDSINVVSTVCEEVIYTPNTFSPNGDGVNDVFIPKTLDLKNPELLIYNRWGELLFITTDIEQGWDGKYNGEVVKTGTYIYRINYTENLTGEPNFIRGPVSVIK